MSAIRNRDRKRHRFPWSLSPGNTGTTVVTQHCKRKRAVLMEEAKTVRRESDTNRCKTRVSSRAFTHREHRCRVKICSPVDMCFLSPLGLQAFFLLHQCVTKPAYLIQPGVWLLLKVQRSAFFLGQIVILTVVLCFLNISGSRVAYAHSAASSPEQGEEGGKVESCLFPL